MKLKKPLLKKIFTVALMLFISYMLLARPGGGHSYSGGGGFSGSYGGDFGDSSGLGTLFFVIFRALPPEVSIPLLIIIFIYFGLKNKNSKTDNFTFISHQPGFYSNMRQYSNVTQQITYLRSIDPNFSRVLFLDFVSSLYTKFYIYQNNKKQLLSLNPFFDKQLLTPLINDNTAMEISEVVIGGIYIEHISIEQNVKIFVRIKSNMTIKAENITGRYIIDERWTLERDKNVISPEPEKMHTVSCPACGAPADFTDSGYCKHCGTLIVPGKMQWVVTQRKIFVHNYFSTNQLLTYAQERGTELPTIFDPFLKQKISVFEQANNVNWPEYEQKFKNKIVQPYFDAIYDAWSKLRWERVRHLISDRLWESYNFWIKAYKEAGLRNVLEINITKIEIVKLEIDRFYEAITVRIFASGLDYIVDRAGKLRAGNKRKPRQFSEYWTFIRRSGVEKDDYDIQTCPACGAPAENIGQAGICEYCGNKITWGDFSWVVAIITQDEEYKG